MALVRAKHARSSGYIYSKKRASLSIFVSTVLLVTTLSPASLALNANNSTVAIPALCDPSTLPLPISPSPAVSISPTPQPEVSSTPEIVPIPNPSEGVEPVAELISEDYVEPVIPAGESSATVSKSEPSTSPKVICPSPVTNVIARPQNTQLEISWIPGISSEPNTIENITDYYIKVLETSQVIKVPSDKTSTIISGLTNGTSYSIIVYAASEYGSSVASDLVTAIPLSGNEGEVAGLIVAFKPEANVEQGQLDVPGEELVSQVELTIENKITEDVHVVEFSEATTLEEAKTIANEISQDPQVVWAEPDQFVYTSSTEVINDPNYSTDQWNLWDKYGIGIGQTNKEMTTAWSLTAGQGINVAVIDTGITSHPDLDSQVIKGFDFVSDPEFLKATREENGPQVSFDGDYINSEKYGSLGWDDNPQDPGDWRGVGPVRNSTWHGTHIAGVIAAQSENQEGIAGIAPGAKIQPIRALSWRGGLLSDIASSITWASGGSVTGVADNPTPAKVINMSFSVNSICPTSLQTAINDAFARGSVLVAAAGNNNDDVKNYAPANCENVISVGASNKDGKRASYSNYGLGIDVSAPGGDPNDNGIYSTSNSGLVEPASFGYASQQGTSISAAHVSAIAARILSTNPEFNPTDVKSQITSKESVREFADTQCDINADIYCGEGIVSLFQIASSPVTSNLVLNLNASIPGINKGTTYNGTTWFDQSGNTRNATAVNSPTYNSSDGSFTLNGTNQYFNLGNILSFTSAFSIEVTFTPNSITGSPMLVTRQNTGVTGNYFMGIRNSKALYGVNTDPWGIDSTSTLSVGTKYTSTLVYDINKDITPYLDGVQNGTKTNYPNTLAGVNIDLLIGAGLTNSAASNFFSGKIHSVRIYNKALSSSEVLQSYNSKTCSPTSQTASGYTTLTFTNSEPCNWSVPAGVTAADVLGVGGGGGGGAGVNGGAGGNEGGGGGGGGVIETLGISVSGSYPIVIGAGGAINQNGTGSSALGVSVSGGGAGGTVFGNGSAGASGGGGTHNRTSGGTGIAGQGFAGGTPPEASRGGGGGGAGEAGNTDGDAHGGDGKVSAITGSTFGGGGTGARNGAGALGGEGGGGVSTQTFNGSLIAASNGSANTGGGGAGGFTNNATPNAGSGGSGIVVIRYVNATCEPTTSPSPPSGYTVLTFTNTTACSWSIPAGVTAADVLVVGGGGAGGGGIGGGGGAGEFIETTRTGLTGGSSVLISVGAGGSPNSSAAGNIGGDSRFDSVIAYGGGGGGTNNANPSVASGGPNLGSQGGGGYENSARTVGSRSDGITGFRNNGGSGSLGGSGNATAGGGGGAGGAGGAGTTSSGSPAQSGGAGGAGKSSSISGVSTFYAGGGGGGVNGASETANGSTPASSGSPGVGGSSIGGSGGAKTNAASPGNFGNRGDGTGGTVNANGTAGVANTGSGGGGASNWVLGGAGGSGIVIVKYAKLTPTLSSISNVSKTYGDSTFSISAPTATFSSSTIAGSVSYSSSNTSVASVSGSTATVVGVGTATFTATFTPTDTSLYNSTTTTFTITVAAKTLTITAEAKSKSFGETTPTNSYTLSTTLVGSDAISSLTYTYSGTNSITSPTAVGSYTITPSSVVFSTGSASNYSITYTAGSYTINKATPTLSSISNVSKTYGDSTFSITDPTATFSGSTIAGSVSYSSSNTSVASVSGSTVTVVGVGTATVTATFTPSSTSSYNSTTTTFTITVAAKTLTITAEAKSKSFGATTPTNSYTLSTTLVGSDAISSLTYTYSGTNSTTAPTAVGSYTITPSSVVFSTGSASNYSITYAAGSYTIGLATQSTLTVSSTSGTFGSALTLTTSGGTGSGSVTYSANTGTATSCTVSGDSLTAGSAGTCFVTATKAADSQYSSISSTSTSVSFAKANQSALSMSSASSVTYGNTLALTSTGGSGTGSTTYAVSSGTCTISGSTLTPGDAGSTCIIAATKAADTNYNSVTTSTQTITINKATQSTLTIDSASTVAFGSTLTLSTTGGSGTGSVTYSKTGTCTISGSTLTPGDAGSSCVVTATKALDTNYNAISSATQTITITKINQSTLSMSSASSVAFGSTLALTSTGGSSTGSTTYAVSSGTCTISSSTLTPGDAGSTCIITATKAADTNYNSVTTSTQTITITKINQSALSMTSASSVTYGNTLALTSTGGSSTGSTTYAVSSGTCTISGSTLTPGDAGSTCIITATKAADTNYNSVTTSTQTITINKATQSSLTNTSTNGTFGTALTLTTSGGSGTGSVTYAATTGTASSCTVSGTSLTAGSAGTCLVTATKAADTNYLSVSSVQTTVSFGKANQSSLSISSTSGTFGSALTLTTSGGSTAGSVLYSVSDGTATGCSESGGSLTVTAAGTCLVTATMAGSGSYETVSSSQTTITFAQAAQAALTVSSTTGTFGTALTLTTSGGSGSGSVTYAATTGTASSCTVSGTSLTAGSAGTCLVTATKASSTNYIETSSIQTTITFAKANQSALSMTSASSVTYGNTLALTSTGGSSTGSTTYAVSSGTCTISSSTLTPGDAGSSCVITATKAADTNYNSVSTSTQTITINKATQSTLTIDSAATVAFGSTLTLSTTGGSGTGSVTYSKTGTCTISSSTLTPGDAGSSCVVTATKALDTNYNAISSATQTITITKINQSALTISSTSGTFGSALTLTTSGGTTAGSVAYSVSDGTASTCAISTGSLSVASAGTCLVTATMAGNTNYNAVVSTQTTITFAKASQSSLTVTSTSGTYGSALTLTTSGGSGDGAVTFVATPGTASSCTVSGSTLTAGSGGTCLVTATKATSTNYLAVSSSQTTVSFGNQAVSLSGFSDISSKNYGDTTFTLTAPTVAGSVAGAFTYSSGTTSVATISSSTVTIIGAGTSTITATFTPTDTGRYSSQTITMLLTVNKKAITITAVDKTKVYAQSTPTNSFTNSTLVGSDAISSLTYTYSGTNSTSAPTTVGNYTITPSSASFSTGSINNYTITYVPAAYSITKATPAFTGFNNVSKTYGDSSFTITAPTVTGSISGSFAYSSSDTSAITISSATATVAGTGSSLITASFTPTDTTNYNSATTTMTISVAKATQSSLSITSASSVNYGSTISLTSSGGSGTGAISFAVTSGTCSISSTTLTPGNAGSTCVIQATKALDTNYNVATSSTQTITINKINQTVSFTSTAPSSPVSGDTYTPLASATSGAIPTISIASSSSSICSLSAGIVTFNTSGTCLIEADSASSTNYNAATTASQSITVAKIAQTITFNQPSASSFGDSSRSMSASASSGLAITYSLGASTTNTACSVSSSGVVTILAVGNCEVTAAQSGNSQYDSALSVSRTFAVNAIVPSAPFLTSVSAGNTNATVSFTAPSSNGGANLSAYEIVAMPTSGSNITKSNCSTSASPLACTITGLINGVSYTFKVAAVNSAGTGAYSTTSGSFTPATIANSVVNLVAQPGDGTLVVNWDQPTNLGGGSFTRYDVYYKSTGSYPGTPNAQINSVSTTTTTFSGLTNGTSYDVKVVAITSANASELAGNTAEVSQYPSTVASAPTNVAAAKLTATSARISWGLPLTDGGASLDATTPYVVTITGGPSAITCGTLSGRTCDISGLNPSSTYSISVKAQNRMGLGTAGTTTYLVPSNDANLLSLDLKTGATLSDPSNATYSPSFDAATTSYSISVANTQAYARITPTVNEATATIKINGIAVVSGVARNLSLGIGSNVFTVEITAGDLATTKTYTLIVTRPKASQMPISITSANSVNYGSTITLSTSGGSGNGLMAFTTTGTCTTSFSGGSYVLTPGDVGSSCSIVATKATDDDYFAASSTSQTITINKTTPTLSDFTNISKTYGDPSFTINEPNVSGNAPGTFTYSSSNTSAITVSGSTITVAGNGSATITATFTPTSSTNYNSATTSLVITVAKKALRVTPANKTKFYGASHPTITNSVIGLAGSEDISTISYSYLGTGSTTYSASTTNPTDAGTYSMTPVITALTSGSLSNYEITYDSADFTISKVNQSALSITSSTSATFGSTLTLTTSGGSGTGAITFTKVSGDCTLNTSGSTYSITPGDAGTNCVVNASKAADTNYNLVSTSDQTITIGKANQSLSFTSSASSPKVNETYTPVVTSTHSSTGVATSITPSVTIDSASAAICSISSGIVTFNAAGSCVINADAVSSTNYNSATTASQTLTITVVTTTSAPLSSASSNTPTPTPSPSSGVRPNATRPIIRNVVERPAPEVVPNLPQLNNPALRPVFPSRNLPTIPNNFDTGLAITDNLGRLPLSEPGEKQIKVGNDFVPVIETVSPQGALTLTIPETINVSPIEVSIQTTDIKGQNIPAPDDGIIRAVKGQTITVSGDGLTPGSTYSVWLFSEPTKLGEGKVSGDATFNKVFLVPDQLATGSHTLQINGINSDQKVVSLTTGVILTEVKEIQNVGDSNSDLIAYAILFIFFLLLIIAILLRYIRKQQLKYLV